MIELNNISKMYEDRRVLDGFSMKIEKNEFVAITGKSGCGKSTLLNIMGLIEKFDEGSLSIKGRRDLGVNTSRSLKFIRHNINYLFQNYALVEEKTVAYNLQLVTRFQKASFSEKRVKMKHVLKELGLNNYEDKCIYQLSGGEQQRVALARAILKPGDIVFADEPTGSLDEENREIVMTHVNKMQREGKTIVLVSHDPVVVSYADRIVSLPKLS